MIILDYILLAAILLFALSGFKKGFLETLGSIIGIILAVILASRFYPLLADYIGGSDIANVISFIIILSLSIKLIGLIFWVFGKIFEVVTILPFISSFDRLLGLVLGLVEGIFITSIILYFLSKYPVSEWLTDQMGESVVVTVLLKVAFVFIPLFPEVIRKVKSVL